MNNINNKTERIRQMEYDVYNLVFPESVNEMEIAEYRFKRVDQYYSQLKKLQWHRPTNYENHQFSESNGINAVTSKVFIPDKESESVLSWSREELSSLSKEKPPALYDILVLLSLFTERNIHCSFGKDITYTDQDCRPHKWGYKLRKSLPYEEIENNSEPIPIIISGIRRNLEPIYSLIKTEDWQVKYDNGFFLFIFLSAIKHQRIELSFLQCYMVWENLFALHNKHLEREKLEKISFLDKSKFILDNYEIIRKCDNDNHLVSTLLRDTRNRLTHTGKYPVEIMDRVYELLIGTDYI